MADESLTKQCPQCGELAAPDQGRCKACSYVWPKPPTRRSKRWLTWKKIAAVLGAFLIVWIGIGMVRVYWPTAEDDESDYYRAFGEVTSTVNEAGFGLANAHVAVSSCVTDEECIAAGDSLSREYVTYIPVIEAQISELEDMEVPEDYAGLHAVYLEQLRIRVESGQLFIVGWETLDEDMIERSFEKFRESQAKVADMLDELAALEEP